MVLLAKGLLAVVTLAAQPPAAKAEADQPATVAEAAGVINLESFPLLEAAKPPDLRRLASLDYVAKGDPRGAYAFQKQTLEARGWKRRKRATHPSACQ